MDLPVVRLSSPADLLGVLPHLVGFHPAESLVVVSLRGPRRRTGLTVRVDLPARAHERRLAAQVADPVGRDGASAAAVVVYTDVGGMDGAGGLPRQRLVAAVTAALRHRGVTVVEALLAGSARWWSYSCSGPCCPPAGTPLPGAPTSAVALLAAEEALRGVAVLPDRAALERSVTPESEERAAALLDVYARARRSDTGGDGPARRAAATQALRATFERYAAARPGVTDEEAARLVLDLHDTAVRDEAATWVPADDAESYVAMLTDLARHAPDAYASAPCTLLAWVAYQVGRGALANVALDRALRSDPAEPVATMLRRALDLAVPPSAVRRMTGGAQAVTGC